jgi:1-deoxy-D-xylulose-5-phosphate reductoisomerase
MGAGRNLDLLVDQVRRFKPELVSVANAELARDLKHRLSGEKVDILHGPEGAIAVATHRDAQFVMSAQRREEHKLQPPALQFLHNSLD